jgi:hypothetical protein
MVTILCNTHDGKVMIQYGHGRKVIVSAEQAEDYAREGKVIADLR